jgi:esterase/lipase
MPTGLSLGGNFAGKLGAFFWSIGKAALSAAGAAAVWYAMNGRPPP